jgi:hypothetical protein
MKEGDKFYYVGRNPDPRLTEDEPVLVTCTVIRVTESRVYFKPDRRGVTTKISGHDPRIGEHLPAGSPYLTRDTPFKAANFFHTCCETDVAGAERKLDNATKLRDKAAKLALQVMQPGDHDLKMQF